MKKKKLLIEISTWIFVFIVLFIIGIVIGGTIKIAFLSSIFFLFVSFIGTKIDTFFGKKRHRSYIETKGFQQLINNGFRVNNKKEIHSIFGIHKGYPFEIFYDPKEGLEYIYPVYYRAIYIIGYYKKPDSFSKSAFEKKLISIAENNKKIFRFSNRKLFWTYTSIHIVLPVGIFSKSSKFLYKYLDRFSDLLSKEGLIPEQLEEVEKIINEQKTNANKA